VAKRANAHNLFKDKVVLITGGTGSFGHAVTRNLLRQDPGEIRIFSRDEAKQDSMRAALANPKVRFYIGDVRDPRSVDSAMGGVDFVFHAAALKQVPACEFFPEQAVMTNVLGTHNVLDAAIARAVTRVVCISTDKAVYPINAMGMSKALMEKLVQAKARALGERAPVICCVRYGNVIYSRGSVIPRFVEQIRHGKPMTITSAEMTRFLLTLDDAVELIKFALAEGRQGEIMVRKAPAATVGAIATALAELFGGAHPTELIGLRHGEKLHETLCTFAELSGAQEHDVYYRIPLNTRDLAYSAYLTEGVMPVHAEADYTSDNTRQFSVAEVKAVLAGVPAIKDAIARHASGRPPLDRAEDLAAE
jgi:UDP-glucose 4-epimerase